MSTTGDAPLAASGRLSVVSTPIGNLRDITLRALDTLREAELILAEDTRHSRKLCAHHGIDTPMRAYHAHSSPAATERALQTLAGGAHVALVTDAGTPLVSDPGDSLVCRAQDAGIRVEVLPGPSAVTAAIAVAGVRFDAFRFVGFLPRRGSKRRDAIGQIAERAEASVLFEAPRRLAGTLADLAEVVDDSRTVAVCRELTKLHEEVARGSARALAERFADGTLGELVIVVGGNRQPAATTAPETLDEAISAALASGESARDAARRLSELLRLPKRDVYARIQALRQAPDGAPGTDVPGDLADR